MVGSVLIAGCLLSAIGYGMSDFFIILAVMISFIVSAYLWFVLKDNSKQFLQPYRYRLCLRLKSILSKWF